MSKLVAIALGLVSSCAVVDPWTSGGDVYVCDVGVELELCWPDSASSLEAALDAQYGLTSVPCARSSRLVTLLGCEYECPPPLHGCNAHNGCYCPGGR